MTREYTELASSTSIGRKVVRFSPTPMMIKLDKTSYRLFHVAIAMGMAACVFSVMRVFLNMYNMYYKKDDSETLIAVLDAAVKTFATLFFGTLTGSGTAYMGKIASQHCGEKLGIAELILAEAPSEYDADTAHTQPQRRKHR